MDDTVISRKVWTRDESIKKIVTATGYIAFKRLGQ